MPDRVDYYINEDWDIEFTDLDDIKTVRGTDSLTQNFVLLAAEHTSEIIGEQLTSTKIHRHRKRLEREFTARESVSSFRIRDIDINDTVVTYTLIIGSEEYTQPVYIQ